MQWGEEKRLLHKPFLCCGCKRIWRKILIIVVKLKQGDIVHDFRLWGTFSQWFHPSWWWHGITWRRFSTGWLARGFLSATGAWQCQWDGRNLLAPGSSQQHTSHAITNSQLNQQCFNKQFKNIRRSKTNLGMTETVLFLEVAGNRTSFYWKHYMSRRKAAPLQCLSFPRHCSHSLKQCWPVETHVPICVCWSMGFPALPGVFHLSVT